MHLPANSANYLQSYILPTLFPALLMPSFALSPLSNAPLSSHACQTATNPILLYSSAKINCIPSKNSLPNRKAYFSPLFFLPALRPCFSSCFPLQCAVSPFPCLPPPSPFLFPSPCQRFSPSCRLLPFLAAPSFPLRIAHASSPLLTYCVSLPHPPIDASSLFLTVSSSFPLFSCLRFLFPFSYGRSLFLSPFFLPKRHFPINPCAERFRRDFQRVPVKHRDVRILPDF